MGGGNAWIIRRLLVARRNVAREVLVPDVTGFRDWNFNAGSDHVLGQRLRDGCDIGAATAVNDPANMSAFDRAALERDELGTDEITRGTSYMEDTLRTTVLSS